jgi:hypothetical protein
MPVSRLENVRNINAVNPRQSEKIEVNSIIPAFSTRDRNNTNRKIGFANHANAHSVIPSHPKRRMR